MKRLFLAALLLMPISAADAHFDSSAFLNTCVADLTAQFAKGSQVEVPAVLVDKFRRMCRCAAIKTLNIAVQPEAVGMTAAALKSVSDKALMICIPEQANIAN